MNRIASLPRLTLACLLALLTAGVCLPPAARAQAPQALELPAGVKVQVQAPGELQGEELAEILETYARQLRAKTVAPTPPVTNAALAAQTVSRREEVQADAESAQPQTGPSAELDQSAILSWWPGRRWISLPNSLLWTPPLANPNEPRIYMKIQSLSDNLFSSVNDFNLGGTMALLRSAPVDRPDDGVQLDLFAMALSRFVERDFMAAVNYRFGVPISFAYGRWSGKLAYEHTSTHLGDEFMVNTGQTPRDGIREEVVFGLAYRPMDEVRLYGIFGHAVHLSTFTENPKPERFSFGAEWSRPASTGFRGQPFAALDVEFRGDCEYTPNVTLQTGWQWLAENARPGMRVALEYYDGRSPFGQFLDRHESWFGVGFFFDY